MFGLSFVLFIQKRSVGKEFQLVRRGFGQKIRNTIGNSRIKFENRNNFIATQINTQVPHSLVIDF